MKKSLLTAFLIAIMISGIVFVNGVHFGLAQTSTNVSGIIISDTVWTKTNSPYSLTGPTAVNRGVTLTIEHGATVNLNNYYMQVNGTLQAVGTNADPIRFNDGVAIPSYAIVFTSVANGWNEQTGSGNIIENAVVASTITSSVSLKLHNNTINAPVTFGGSSIVTGNIATAGVGVSGSSVVMNNTFASLLTAKDSTIVKNNTLSGGVYCGGTSEISYTLSLTEVLRAATESTARGILTSQTMSSQAGVRESVWTLNSSQKADPHS